MYKSILQPLCLYFSLVFMSFSSKGLLKSNIHDYWNIIFLLIKQKLLSSFQINWHQSNTSAYITEETIDIWLNRPSTPFENARPTATPVWRLPMSSNHCIEFEFPAQIYKTHEQPGLGRRQLLYTSWEKYLVVKAFPKFNTNVEF